MVNINQFMAGKNKAVIAQFLGDRNMLGEALHQGNESMNLQPGNFICGSVDFAYKMILDNVLTNFESYGDLTIVDGDTHLVESKINLDIESDAFSPHAKWCLNLLTGLKS
ncbi:hypothetical protein RHD99_10990 [Buttiauxella selenatireducens]|uniref:Uncharacterized protein n=1 Tax=Buttiauxella selenatireducens TaxID=3073902 RepID=A0ABY9SGF2_9ENTR|nr:hypothetical protein [Buttiauxella sp. R73]WMY76408.1 hypothetical protein RHD99_10990 [Buttiauxella sp. R73]